MKKILFVNPAFGTEFLDLEKMQISNIKALMMPLQFATLAALTPDDIEVNFWDEAIHGLINESTELGDYDLIGITSYNLTIPHARNIARIFRQRGIPVAIGGPGVSTEPERCYDAFDIVFMNEVELTWPKFVGDWKKGKYFRKYRQVTKPDLSVSPVPRWDGLIGNVDNYYFGAVQTTRGCPYNCEFCNVTYLLGHRPRYKPIDQVLEEVSNIERLGMLRIFMCDDNFIGNPRYVKDLLRELISLNNSFEKPIHFFTQVSINIANDEEVLSLLADANFGPLFIGIESPNKESLKETNKIQNYRSNLLEDLKKIESYGLPIIGSFIVGFDHDDASIFDQHLEFLQENCITNPQIRILSAPKGSKLWTRLLKEERIIDFGENVSSGGTNIIPKQMTRVELMKGFGELLLKSSPWDIFAVRVKSFISGIINQPKVPQGRRGFSSQQTNVQEIFSALDKNTKSSILEIIQYTFQKAPFMLSKVIQLIMEQIRHSFILKPIYEQIQEQIQLEESNSFNPKIMRAEVLITESFKDTYKAIFPDIYHYVLRSLQDKTFTEAVLISVFTDFLIRWGQSSKKFEEDHHTYLMALVDKAITENAVHLNSSIVLVGEGNGIQEIEMDILAEEILKAVEQEMRIIKSDLPLMSR